MRKKHSTTTAFLGLKEHQVVNLETRESIPQRQQDLQFIHNRKPLYSIHRQTIFAKQNIRTRIEMQKRSGEVKHIATGHAIQIYCCLNVPDNCKFS